MKRSWTDAHCHLTDARLLPALDTYLTEAEGVGISQWVLAGYSPDDWKAQKQLRNRLGSKVVLSFGLHPWWVHQSSEEQIESGLLALESALPEAEIVGELGLDLFKDRRQSLKKQAWVFSRQLECARSTNKPVALHLVHADSEALTILRPIQCLSGWVHSFSGNAQQVKPYLDLGLHISLSGSALRLPEEKLRALLGQIPEDRLLIETDAPDQKPRLEELEGQEVNRPANLVKIAHHLGHFCGKTAGVLLDQSRKNLERVLG